MNITKEEVRAIAHIARIAVQEEELEGLAQQLGAILSYAQRVTELAEDVVQVGFDGSQPNRVRTDVIQPSPVEAVMSIAPDVQEGYYVVPKILENTK